MLIVVCAYFCVAGSGDGASEQWGPEEISDTTAKKVM